MMANISMTREHTTTTLDMEGIEANRALTTSFMPSSLEMTLRGRRALRALSALSA